MIHFVIMAGGKGTRFWPLSRQKKGKQFLKLVDQNTLIESTIERCIKSVKQDHKLWIVSNQGQVAELDSLKKTYPDAEILLEPIGKNTAPCIGWAALCIQAQDPEGIMVSLPADHYVPDLDSFKQSLNQAIEEADTNNTLVTLGITPTHAHTGYGYIQVNQTESIVKTVSKFKEKPAKDIAEQYVASGHYYWNSGMFVWKASVILEQMTKYMPDNVATLKDFVNSNNDTDFHNLTDISIDYGIMEHSADITRLVPATFEWHDIGNWTAIEHFWTKDENGNAIYGDYIEINSHNNIIRSQSKTISTVDIDNLIIIETDDAILITPKSSDQRIKDLYDKLPESLQ